MSKSRGEHNVHALLAGLAALVLLTGVVRSAFLGGVGSHARTHIAFWNGFTGPDGIVMLKIIEDFNRKNPDVEVLMQRIPWATYYNKLTVACSDGRGPQVFISHADALARLRRAGFLDDASDLYGGPDGIDKGDFDKYVADYVDFDGKMMGVPLDIHPQGMYCDVEMLKEAGYVDAQGNARAPRTKAEFLDLVHKATIEPGGKLKDKQWGFAMTFWGLNYRCLMPQFGGRFLDDEGNPVLNSEGNVRAMEFLYELSKEKLIPPPDNGLGWTGFRTKRVAMAWDGVYMVGDLMRLNDFAYIGAPIPTIGDQPGTVANSHVMCLRKGLSEKERDAASRFVKYLSKNSLRWAAAGQVPARVSVRNEPGFAELQVQHAFAEQVPHMIYPPKTPVIFEFVLESDQAVERVMRGTMKPQESLDLAQKNAQALIDRDRREYPQDYKQGAKP